MAPIRETVWAVRFGMLLNRFGTPRMIQLREVNVDTRSVD